MEPDTSDRDLEAQLGEVDRDLEDLRKTAQSVRAGVGDEDDPADRGALIQQADELDGLVDQLVLRRDDLLRRIGSR